MYLYGASGHAKVIIDILKSEKIFINGLFDDNPNLKSLLEYPVMGKFSLSILDNEKMIVTIGTNSVRKRVVETLPNEVTFGYAFSSIAAISEYSEVGEGTVIMQGAIIQSGTKIGKHCIINTQASVDHDCFLGNYVHISPNSCLCGGVIVGEGTQVGAGAVVIPGIKIGKWSIIGAGSVVLKDVPDNVLVFGNPSNIIKKI